MNDVEHRDRLLRSLMQQGVELAEELIKENASLRHQIAEAEHKNRELKMQLSSDDTVAELLTRVDALEQEQTALYKRASELEQTSRVHEGRFREVERELNDLASLYVASCQLSATLVPGRVVRHICELLEQLVGIHAFVMYLVEPDGELATPLSWQNVDEECLVPQSLNEGELGSVCLTGLPIMRDPTGEDGEPIAIIPLMADGQAVVVISVLELLPHKKSWAPVDSELFRLLSERASGALIAANLYDAREGPRAALCTLGKQATEPANHDAPRRSDSEGGGR